MTYLEMAAWVIGVWFVVALGFGLIFGRVMARGLGPWE